MHFWKRVGEGGTKDRIYMDYAAATPVRHAVLEVVQQTMRTVYGNASSIHAEGQEAKRLLEEARTEVARVLGVRPAGVHFTSGGTEANNLALFGVIEAALAAGRVVNELEVVTTHIEHPSLTAACAALEQQGVKVIYVPVLESGLIDVAAVRAVVSEKTVLFATSYVNSEIGVIQPVRKIKRILEEQASGAVLLVDGAQAPLWLPCQLETLGADILTLDSSKLYGPKGVGALVVRHGVSLAPTLYGGGQEGGVRPGTENIPLIVGFDLALTLAQKNREQRAATILELRQYALARVSKAVPSMILNGDITERVANNINISLPGIDTEFLTVWLDAQGVSVSTKSACSGAGGGRSAVVLALSNDATRASSTLRLTLGETTTKAEIDRVVELLQKQVTQQQLFDSTS